MLGLQEYNNNPFTFKINYFITLKSSIISSKYFLFVGSNPTSKMDGYLFILEDLNNLFELKDSINSFGNPIPLSVITILTYLD